MPTVHQMRSGQSVDERSERDFKGVDDRVVGHCIWSSRLRPNGHGIVEVGLSEISKQ